MGIGNYSMSLHVSMNILQYSDYDCISIIQLVYEDRKVVVSSRK